MMVQVMALNSIKPLGDDQQWKAEVEKTIKELQETIAILKAQVNSRGK